MPDFDIAVAHDPDTRITLATLTGHIGPAEAQTMEQRFEKLVQSGPALVVLDLSHVGALSSQAAAAIAELHRQLAAGGAALRLAAPMQTVRDAIRKDRLDTLLQITDTLDDALAA